MLQEHVLTLVRYIPQSHLLVLLSHPSHRGEGARYVPQSLLLLSHPSHRVQVHLPISTTPQSLLTQGPGTSPNLNYSSVTPHTGCQVHPPISTTPQSPLTQGPGTSLNLNYSTVTPHTGSRYIPQSQLLLSHPSHRVQVHLPISTTPQSPLTQGPGTSLNLNYSTVTPHTWSRYIPQSQLLLSHPSHRVPGTSLNLNYSSVTPHTGSRYIPQSQLLHSHPSHMVQVHPSISTTPQSPLTQGPGTSPNLNYSSVTPNTGSRYIINLNYSLVTPHTGSRYIPQSQLLHSHPSHRVQVHPSISTTPQSPLTQGPGTSPNLNYSSVTPHTGSRYISLSQLLLSHSSHRVPGTSLNLNYSSVTPHTGSRYIPQSQLLHSHPSHMVQVHPSISTTPQSPLTQGPGTSPNLNYSSVTPHTGSRYIPQSQLLLSHSSHRVPGTSLNLNYSSVTPHTGSRYIPQSQLLHSHPSHMVQVHPSISTTPQSPLTQGPGTSPNLNYSSVTPNTGSRYIINLNYSSVTPHTGSRYISQSQLLLNHSSHRVQVHPSISTTPQSPLTQGRGCQVHPSISTTPQSPLTQGARYIPQSQLLLSHPSHRVQVHVILVQY